MDEAQENMVIVEFPMESGVRAVARSPEELAKRSGEALDNAMGTIRGVAAKTKAGIDSIVDKPDEVEVSFGITLTAEAGALVAKVGGEATLQVTLAWSEPK
ncbi:MAG: hypothetical protein M3340_04630 [Actinomycetota bacterium]|nr:hypothetical protein [Actinomycetota bacterium]